LLLDRVPVIGFQVDETSEREQVKWRRNQFPQSRVAGYGRAANQFSDWKEFPGTEGKSATSWKVKLTPNKGIIVIKNLSFNAVEESVQKYSASLGMFT
jgi:hypothetical protein